MSPLCWIWRNRFLETLDLSNIYVLNYLNEDKLPFTDSHAEPFIVLDIRNTKICKLNYCLDYFFLFVYWCCYINDQQLCLQKSNLRHLPTSQYTIENILRIYWQILYYPNPVRLRLWMPAMERGKPPWPTASESSWRSGSPNPRALIGWWGQFTCRYEVKVWRRQPEEYDSHVLKLVSHTSYFNRGQIELRLQLCG